MHTLTKETAHLVTLPATGQGWELLLPDAAGDLAYDELHETRTALQRAETVMRAQQERIRQLEQLAVTDELTGLANRRGFAAAFERELSLARRDTGYCGILVMIDLDGFKAINDTWGHQAGDAYLCTVAEVLRESVRESDTVARLGGDEFALLLTHMDEKNGAKRLAKLEQAFAKQALTLRERIPLRASFGYASYAGSDSADLVIQRADVRLYAHKARSKQLKAAV